VLAVTVYHGISELTVPMLALSLSIVASGESMAEAGTCPHRTPASRFRSTYVHEV
jgi:hypothetical protein